LYQAGSAGAKTAIPPIPKMEAAPPPGRPSDIGREIRQAIREAQQEARQARVTAAAQKTGQLPAPGTPTTAPQPDFTFPTDVPPRAMEMMSMFFVFVGVLVIGTPIVRALARRFDRKTDSMRIGGPDLTPQLRQLQESVDAMAIEVERISEGQRFTSKLLAERAAAVTAPQGRD
jgi:hypothetical protein